MKNVHVLPTEKPSRLYYSGNNHELILSKQPVSFRIFERSTQHIYITSDEEIKDEDWCVCEYSDGDVSVNTYKDSSGFNKYKIILTTDQDLIKDGLQAIDDEFLEWFVKNPSCETVEVSTYHVKGDISGKLHYKIIIPKEEPKPIHEQIIEHCGGEEKFNEIAGLKPKQETLEEAAERIFNIPEDKTGDVYFGSNIAHLRKGFKLGAKWQQEQKKNKYSEEDLKEAFAMGRTNATIKDFNTKFKNK